MTLLRKFIIGMGILLADIVLLSCCLYFTVIANKIDTVHTTLLLWIGLIIIGHFLNLLIVKQSGKIASLAIWNICWMAVIAIVAALTFDSSPVSIPLKIFVCGVLIAIQGHSIAQSILPHRAENHLTFLDIQVVVFAIFLAGCHIRSLQDVMGLQILGFLSLGYTLAALVFLRTFEEQVAIVKGDSVAGRAKVFGLLGGIVAACSILCAALAIMAQHATKSILDIFILMLQHIKNGLARIGTMLTNLFSRIPQSDTEGTLPLGGTGEIVSEESGAEAIMRLPEWVLPLVGIFIAVIIACVVIRLVYKFRKETLSFDKKTYHQVEITFNILQRKKVSIFLRLLEKFRLRLKMYRGRKTPQGLAILIRKAGKSIGIEMHPEDSWHGYVLRLAPYGDIEKLQQLSDFLKEYFYGGYRTDLTKEQYHIFANALRHLKK